jgi:hypothetical protein
VRVSIRWTDAERQTVLAALDEGAVPQLDADVASKIRAATAGPASDDVGPGPAVDLEFHEAQRLKQWCDARREHATEDEPNALWTRIVARVNEVVQIAAPATDPGLSGGPARPPA